MMNSPKRAVEPAADHQMAQLDGIGEVCLHPERAQLYSDAMRDLFDIWDRAKGDALMPSQNALPVTALAHHIDHLILYQFEAETGRPTVAASGAVVNQLIGFEPRGHYVDTFPGMEAVVARLTWMRENAVPYLTPWLPLPAAATLSNSGANACSDSAASLREHAILALPIGHSRQEKGHPPHAEVTATLVYFAGR